MKKIRNGFILCVLFFVLTGCGSGISEEQYNAVCAERDALRDELQELKDSLASDGEETVLVSISGGFTAQVRALIPGYILDGTTPQVAVVTLFQDGPFTLYVGELAEQLEVGETYVFEVEPKKNVEITAEEYENGVPYPDEAIDRYGLRISGFRAAEEGERGLEVSRLAFKKD